MSHSIFRVSWASKYSRDFGEGKASFGSIFYSWTGNFWTLFQMHFLPLAYDLYRLRPRLNGLCCFLYPSRHQEFVMAYEISLRNNIVLNPSVSEENTESTKIVIQFISIDLSCLKVISKIFKQILVVAIPYWNINSLIIGYHFISPSSKRVLRVEWAPKDQMSVALWICDC